MDLWIAWGDYSEDIYGVFDDEQKARNTVVEQCPSFHGRLINVAPDDHNRGYACGVMYVQLNQVQKEEEK